MTAIAATILIPGTRMHTDMGVGVAEQCKAEMCVCVWRREGESKNPQHLLKLSSSTSLCIPTQK